MKQAGIVAVAVAVVAAAALAGPAPAQVQSRVQSEVQSQSAGVARKPAPKAPQSPFGAQWALPPGPTGTYIYRDPRLVDPYAAAPRRRATRCPAPSLFDPASGRCR